MTENTNHTIIAAARNMLRDIDPAPFTQTGLQSLIARVEHYIDDLLLESLRIARRHQSETVSPKHVEWAADLVFARRKRRLFTLLGVLGGAAVGAVIQMTMEVSARSTPIRPSEVVVACCLVGFGVAGVTLQLIYE